MRIAVVHNLRRGGARRRLANQIEHLQGEVSEICLGTANPITADPAVVPFRTRAPRMHRVVRPPLRYLDLVVLERAWRAAARAIRSSGADVIYLNQCQFLQAPPVPLDGLPPSLYWCDEPRRVDVEPEARATRNPLTNPVYGPMYARQRHLDRALTLSVSRVATNSQYTAKAVERVYGRRPEVIPSGVVESLIQPALGAADERFLLSVGTLIPPKGHDLVLRAAALAESRPSVRIVAARTAPEEETRLRRLAEQHGVGLEISIGLTDAELGRLYAAAHVTLYLARREPLGLASLEAQACGCPVIVAAEGGLPETIVDGSTGWQVARDPVAAAALVDRLSDDRLRARMSAAARAHARPFTWGASAARVENLLREISGQA